jgi:hypothetical protein
MPALVSVESPKGADEAHPVSFVTEVGVGWGDRAGAEVGSDGGEGAAGEGAPQMQVLPEESLLGGVIVCEDRIAQSLNMR